MGAVVLLGNGNTGSLYVTSAGLELEIFRLQLPKRCGYKHGTPLLPFFIALNVLVLAGSQASSAPPSGVWDNPYVYLGSSDPSSVCVCVRGGMGWGTRLWLCTVCVSLCVSGCS